MQNNPRTGQSFSHATHFRPMSARPLLRPVGAWRVFSAGGDGGLGRSVSTLPNALRLLFRSYVVGVGLCGD
jgi:hypothetical protein